MIHLDPPVILVALILGYVLARGWWWLRCRTYRKQPIPHWMWIEVMDRGRWRCANPWCHSEHELQADHKWPEWFLGRTVLSNLQPLCKACNRRKGAKVKIPLLPWWAFWLMLGRSTTWRGRRWRRSYR